MFANTGLDGAEFVAGDEVVGGGLAAGAGAGAGAGAEGGLFGQVAVGDAVAGLRIGYDLRPELKACHAFLDPGDTLVVPSLDRYGRSLQDLVDMVAELRERGIAFHSLHEALDTTTPGGCLIFHVFAALAEFIRELIVTGTHEGLAAARARGKIGGRPTVVDEDLIRAARDMLPNPASSVTSIAKILGVSSARSTTTSRTSNSS